MRQPILLADLIAGHDNGTAAATDTVATCGPANTPVMVAAGVVILVTSPFAG